MIAKAAWSYINQEKNASKYDADELAKVKGRIKAACEKFGIEIRILHIAVDGDVLLNGHASVAPGLDGETGRGLHLVDSLTKRWGCCPRRPVGKIVWGEVAA